MFPSKIGEANENRSSSSKERVNLSFKIEKYPTDLLQRFMSSEAQASTRSEGEEEEEEKVELNLGLSLGGRFGVDKSARKLTRSSSIAGSIPMFREDGANTPPPVPYPILIRTSSLPTETEEEWRKRKELQTLRRMEAKRRRSEKQRSSREKMEVNLLEEEKQAGRANTIGVGPPLGLQSWAAAARQVILGGGNEAMGVKGKGGGLAAAFSQGSVQPCPQGSMESQGGSSSCMSEMENKALQGASSCGEARSSGSTQSLQDQANQEAMGSSGTKTAENRGKERGNTMEDMPCVFTKGEGPDGKRIEGILYKYGKGEEVRIMCVCHGDFLSPAEFVKHAGGGDVDHPLRHIVVNPSSASLL
ncbi:ninja-family protein AFP1-like [Durio zibethinus]|uniref:Ninja-family protein n=1 Tax=Durio zibethinus TaxID=66656 RepID=A0A6P5Y0M4_DURZI|nr:ninja-family protein AFP1-like [Durio zibethinus]